MGSDQKEFDGEGFSQGDIPKDINRIATELRQQRMVANAAQNESGRLETLLIESLQNMEANGDEQAGNLLKYGFTIDVDGETIAINFSETKTLKVKTNKADD